MHRYSVDHAVTYTPDDVVLFRESPFAAWMERLTLENPDHGIPPDRDSIALDDNAAGRDEIVTTLRAEGRNVVLVDQERDESERRTATLAAMRGGADFIVNGQLAVGALSGRANLLMRTSGYSDLGDFLYIPCETLSVNDLQSAFRLCFIAELLRTLQGQLPPQMLIIRDGAEVVPLQTEDHIHYYRAVLQRFMLAMTSFRKHRMPDPAESAHLGRWSDCANEVLKQRAQGERRAEGQQAQDAQGVDDTAAEATQQEAVIEMPQLRVAGGAGAMHSHYEVEEASPAFNGIETPMIPAAPEIAAGSGVAGPTLVEQALQLVPNSFRGVHAPSHTPNLARSGRRRAVAAVPIETAHKRRSSDAALQNLEFIGSNATDVSLGTAASAEALVGPDTGLVRPPPAPNLRETPNTENAAPEARPAGLPELEPRAPVFLPPDRKREEPTRQRQQPEPSENNADKRRAASSIIDLDSAPAPNLAPVVQRAEAEFARIGLKDPMFRTVDQSHTKPLSVDPAPKPFSDSLVTSQELNDC